MDVEVTQSHIERGQRGECSLCPVALALSERGYTRVEVYDHIATAYDGLKRKAFILPVKARYWIRDFDDGIEVRPFKFQMGG